MKAADLAAVSWARGACTSGEARKIREDARLTLDDMAAGCGVTRGAVWLWETGQRVPGRGKALAYAKLLRSLQKAKAA